MTLEDLKSGQFYQSLVPLEGETLEQIFEHYLAQSEQATAFLRLKADGGALCGLLLEKLPRADLRDPDGWNRVMPSRRNTELDETRDAQPYDLLTRVFPEELMRVFRLYAVEYHCPYDEGKVKDMLLGLGRAGSRVDPRRAGRGRDPQRDVQPRVPLRREGDRRAVRTPLKKDVPMTRLLVSALLLSLAACSDDPPPAKPARARRAGAAG